MPSGDVLVMVIISTLAILLLVAAAIITIVLSNRRHVQQEVKYERELRTAEQEVREQVLINIGRELHDNIGQLLTVMHLQMEQQRITNPSAAQTLGPVAETLTHTIQEVRRVGKSLNSDLLDNNGLINTIQNEVQRLQQIGKFQVQWEYDTEPELVKDQKVIAFRIFQEAVNNALKHANASNLNITLSGSNKFKLVVSDNGKGFDIDSMLRSPTGSGLKNMIKRAELAKLKCSIAAAPGKGASFTLETI